MKRNTLKKIIQVIGLCMVAMLLCSCSGIVQGREPLPEDTIEEMELAYNQMNAEAMMECLDEKTKTSVTAGIDLAMGIFGAVSGVDLGISGEDLISMLPIFQEFANEYTEEAGYAPVDFLTLETYIKGDRATVSFMETNSGEIIEANMIKEDGRWKVTLGGITVTADTADEIIMTGQEEETDVIETDNEEIDWLKEIKLKDLNAEQIAMILEEMFSGE